MDNLNLNVQLDPLDAQEVKRVQEAEGQKAMLQGGMRSIIRFITGPCSSGE